MKTDTEDCDTFTCCCSPCIGLCYLFCLKRMTVSSRLTVVWIWIISLSLFSGLYIRYKLYGTDNVSITSFDMIPVQKMSTVFCEGVTVAAGSTHTPLAVYRLNNKPRINYTHTVYNTSNIFLLLSNTKKLIHYYLMAGSSIKLTFCSGESLYLIVIKGTDKYEKYLETYDYRKYTESSTTIFSGCRSKTFNISESNRYYFLISQNWRGSNVQLNVTLNKTTYKVHGEDSQLENIQWEVFVPLKFQSTESIIYQPALEDYQELTVTTSCKPMNSLYVGFFLGGFLALGLILTYFVKCLSKDPIPSTEPPETAPSDNLSLTEPAPTIQIHPTAPPLPDAESSTPWLSEPRTAPSCSPPSYESLFVNTADNEPPSYLSTTKGVSQAGQ